MLSNATSTKGVDMPAAADAILEDDEGRAVLRFERTLAHPPERVWTALTEVDDLRHWHPSPFELERRAGGAIHYLPPEGAAFGDGKVIAYEPPSLLAYSWGEDELRWELEPTGTGTLLTLTHAFDDRLKAARDAAGWDLCLAALGRALGGDRALAPTGERALLGDWDELNHAYQERFGIPAERAAKPPSQVAAAESLAPLLMFAGDAQAAMDFYASVFFPARIERLERYRDGEPGEPGAVKLAVLRIGDQLVRCIDGGAGHAFTFTPAISLAVRGASVDAVDRAFARLADGGTVLMPLDRYPFSDRFGWVTDRFGVSWQISLA
jgi:predicted 3-demethylubiquinone-9 3-methyltransferase (glyoxalase superfamily)/uncharacterized protein YndB with AHSA1/START domain